METLFATALRTRLEPGDAERARAFLDELMARVGVDGLVAALRAPALKVIVDHHTAVIRESLVKGGLELQPAALAGYAAAMLLAAQQRGRLLPVDPGGFDWAAAECYLLRLVAVCAIADDYACL